MIDLFLFSLLFTFQRKKLNKNVINYKYANFFQWSCKCVSLEVNNASRSERAHSEAGIPARGSKQSILFYPGIFPRTISVGLQYV